MKRADVLDGEDYTRGDKAFGRSRKKEEDHLRNSHQWNSAELRLIVGDFVVGLGMGDPLGPPIGPS